MPTYIYKAMTKQGQIVKNRINESSKISCIKKLKRNELAPISVVQTLRLEKRQKRKPRNFRYSNSERKKIGAQKAENTTKMHKMTVRERILSKFAIEKKITARDIRIFTQNFYLLKKANFNNVHA